MTRAARTLLALAWALAAWSLTVMPAWSADVPARDFMDLKSADDMLYDAESRTVRAHGNVRFSYADVEAEADDLTADLGTNRAVLGGAVTLRARGQEFRGATLLVNLDTRTWEFASARGAISPRYFQQGVRSPLYLGAADVLGQPDHLEVRGGQFTTCDRARPHYQLTARSLRIWPGSRLVADHVTLWLLGRRIMTLPRFVVPLRGSQRQPFVPVVGRSDLDGLYLKTLLNYALSDRSFGAGHLDLMTRRGVGGGIDHTQLFAGGRTTLYLYQAQGTNTGGPELTVAATHNQDLGDGLTLNATADLRSNSSYYQSGNEVTTAALALTRHTAATDSALSLDYSRTESTYDYSHLAATLRHDSRSSQYDLSLESRYSDDSTYSGGPDDRELTNRLALTDHETSADVELVVSKRWDVDGDDYTGDSYYQVVDYLPELQVRTDTRRLRMAPLGLPAKLTLSVGDFYESSSALRAYRVHFGYDGLPVTQRIAPATRMVAQMQFRQDVYGDEDHTAQYAYGGSARLEQDLGAGWQARTSYTLLDQKGYSPFLFDYVGAYNTASLALNYQRSPGYRALVRTGYDVRTSQWQDVIARVETPLSRTLQLALSGGYDPNLGNPRALSTTLRFGDHNTTSALTVRYQPAQHRVERVVTQLEWDASPKWHLQTLTGYDGVQRKFVYGEVMVKRDLHCWEAAAYYSLQRKLFRLDLRIKAFDWGRSDFGVGKYGQPIDTNSGDWY